MAKATSTERLLARNAKTIEKAVRDVASGRRPPGEYRIDGVRGLVLNILLSGTATWYFHYDLKDGRRQKRRKSKLGRLDDVTVAEASDRTDALRHEVSRGGDPARSPSKDTLTFAEMVDERFRSGDQLRPDTIRDYRQALDKDVLPSIGSLAAAEISRTQIITILDEISERGSTRRADTVRAIMSSIFAFGVDRGLVQSNPASGLKNRHRNEARTNIAGPEDIRTLWLAIDNHQAPVDTSIARVIRLTLLTGQRRAEVVGATKDELQLEGPSPVWTIPTGRAKNRTEHRLPLAPLAQQLFQEAVDEAGGGSPFVFPGHRGNGQIHPDSVSTAMARMCDKLGIKKIIVHDLRRTMGTYMSQYGVPVDIRGLILNHGGKRKGNITEGVYNRYHYEIEMRSALELWADAILAIAAGGQSEIDDYGTRLMRLRGNGTVQIDPVRTAVGSKIN